MNWINFDIYKYIGQFLGRLFGKTNQIKWLYCLLYPLQYLWLNYDEWRRYQYYLINVTSQSLVLQNHLNNKFDNELRRILIIHGKDEGMWLGVASEVNDYQYFGLNTETEEVYIAMKGEKKIGIAQNFIVYIPKEMNNESKAALNAELMKYKLAGKTFDLIKND